MSETNITEVEATEESPLEQVISKELVKNNVTKQVINALKRKYGSLKLKSLEDKEGYLEIKAARKEVRKLGILTENLCKAGREDANKIQKLWISKEKEVLGMINEVQDPLDEEIKKYEEEQSRKEQEERERQEQQFMKRQTTLLKMEAVYEGNSFSLGSVSYDINNIKEADEEIWEETILPKFKREFEKIESVRAEEERKRQEEADKLRKEKEDFERQQQEFKEQQEQLRKQQEELQRQKDEADKREREQKEKEAAEVREKQDAQNKSRMQQVMALGLQYSLEYKSFIFGDVAVAEVDIIHYSQEKWDEMILQITPTIQKQKEDIAKREEERIEQEKQKAADEAAKKERDRIEEENRQAELRRKQEEERKAEEAAKASDKDKWAAFVDAISAIQVPEFKSSVYKGKLVLAKEKIEELRSL